MIMLTGPDGVTPGSAIIYCLSGVTPSYEVKAALGGMSLPVQTDTVNGVIKVSIKTKRTDVGIVEVQVADHGSNATSSTTVS